MKKFIAIAFVVCWCAAPAHGALLLYEGFAPNAEQTGPYNYQPGEPLAASPDPDGGNPNGQYNASSTFGDKYWRYSAAGSTPTPTIASGSLSYPGLYPSAGNKVTFDHTQVGGTRLQVASAISSGTVYWSAVIQVTALGSTLNTINGVLLGGFNNVVGPQTTNVGSVGAVLRIRKDPNDASQYNIGTAMNSGTGAGNIQWSSAFTPSITDTIFLVAAYEIVAGATNDKAYMWINPSPTTFMNNALIPSPTLTSAPSLADSFASISTFNLRNVNTVGSATVFFDELRVGTDWASVTPTPEASSFIAFGLCGVFSAAAVWFGKRRGLSLQL